MKSQNFNLVRYDADEGMVFDWKEPHYINIFGNDDNIIDQKLEHLYVKTLFIGLYDNINNYIEVPAPEGE